MPNLDKNFLEKVYNRKKFYSKDNDATGHAISLYEASLNRRDYLLENEDMRVELLAISLVAFEEGCQLEMFPELPKLLDMTRVQLGTVRQYSGRLDELLSVDERGAVEFGEGIEEDEDSSYSDDEPENIVEDEQIHIRIDVGNNEINTFVNHGAEKKEDDGYYHSDECIIDQKLLADIFYGKNIDNFVEGKQPSGLNGAIAIDDDEEEPTKSMHTYFAERLDSIRRGERGEQTIEDKKKACLGKLEIYSALKERGANRGFWDVVFHPYNTFREWLLKNNLGNELKDQYHLNDATLGKISDICNGNAQNNLLYIDNNGTTVNPAPKEEYVKPKTEFDIAIDNAVNEVKHRSKDFEDDLAKSTEIFASTSRIKISPEADYKPKEINIGEKNI